MAGMIFFNDTSLESVAPQVRIMDVRVSPIALNPVARQRGALAGADFVRIIPRSRTVEVSFALIDDEWQTRQDALLAVNAWAISDTPGRLQLPGHEGRYLEAICTQLPEPSLRQWWESKLRVVFTTMDNPYWTSETERTAACGTAFYVSGSAEPMMQITRTLSAAATNQSYSDGTSTMTFSEIPAGDMAIDLNRQTAAVGGTSIMSAYSFSSTFIKPRMGSMTITGTGTVRWRERWM
jgi:hypothetical protein